MTKQKREMQVYELRMILYGAEEFLPLVQREVNEHLNDPAFQTSMVEKLGRVIHHGKNLCDIHRVDTCDWCGDPNYHMFGFKAICNFCLDRRSRRP